MSDINLSANTIVIILIAYSLACAFCGAAIAFGLMECQARKSQRKPKHIPTNLTA